MIAADAFAEWLRRYGGAWIARDPLGVAGRRGREFRERWHRRTTRPAAP